MDIRAAREGIAELLKAALPGWQVTDYALDSPNPPALMVGYPTSLTYNLTINGKRGTVEFPVIVVISAADTRSAQVKMDSVLGANVDGSVHDVLHGATGSGWFGPVVVLRAENVARAQTVGGVQLFAADIVIRVTA